MRRSMIFLLFISIILIFSNSIPAEEVEKIVQKAETLYSQAASLKPLSLEKGIFDKLGLFKDINENIKSFYNTAQAAFLYGRANYLLEKEQLEKIEKKIEKLEKAIEETNSSLLSLIQLKAEKTDKKDFPSKGIYIAGIENLISPKDKGKNLLIEVIPLIDPEGNLYLQALNVSEEARVVK